jgi:hypothetical protein
MEDLLTTKAIDAYAKLLSKRETLIKMDLYWLRDEWKILTAQIDLLSELLNIKQ